MRRFFVTLPIALLVACISHVDANPDSVLTNPNDPSEKVETTPSIVNLCGVICDALIESYGVPPPLKDACVFECATGFNKTPDACYELVACVADHSLCANDDISPGCLARAGDCLPNWSLANGTCRHCWEPSRPVHGKQIVTYLSEGTVPVDPEPEDFTDKKIAALLPRANGDPYLFAGTGAKDGTYQIANVPGCGVWIQVGTTYTWAGNADVDTSYTFPGRRSGTVGGPGTQYHFTVSNTTPWTSQDWFEFFVPQLAALPGGFWGLLPPYDPMDPGAPKVGASTVDYHQPATDYVLVDPKQKDVIYFAQLSSAFQGDGTVVRTVQRAARVTDFAPMPGQENLYAVALDTVMPDRTAHIDFKRSQFVALGNVLHPKSVRGVNPDLPPDQQGTQGIVDIFTSPGSIQRTGATAELVLVDHDAGRDADIFVDNIPYGSPYDKSWRIDIDSETNWYVSMKTRNGDSYYGLETVTTLEPAAQWNNAPIVPRIAPPRNIRVNGLPASQEQTGAALTLTPTIEWDAPVTGEPSRYQVLVNALTGKRTEPPFYTTQGTGVARFEIPTLPGQKEPALHGFRLPPGILVRGTDYYFVVLAGSPKNNDVGDNATNVTSEYRP